MTQERQEGRGCGTALLAVILVMAAVVGAVISVAALVDPFSWLPPVGEIWEDCQDDLDTPEEDCDPATRFPGFWAHVILNFLYVVATAGLLLRLARAVAELREARPERFSGPEAAQRYRRARQTLALTSTVVGLLAALPIIVAIA